MQNKYFICADHWPLFTVREDGVYMLDLDNSWNRIPGRVVNNRVYDTKLIIKYIKNGWTAEEYTGLVASYLKNEFYKELLDD